MSKAIFNAYAEAGGNFWAQFAADSPLEEDGFELVVPPRTKRAVRGPRG